MCVVCPGSSAAKPEDSVLNAGATKVLTTRSVHLVICVIHYGYYTR